MDHQLIILRPPIPTADFQQVERMLRESGIVTCFDSSVDPACALRFVSEKARFGTETRALVDLNVFRDILSLGRVDPGRHAKCRKLAAALVLYFQAAEILVEPSMALHESPLEVEQEIKLFRQIDNAEPLELLEVFHGKRTSVTLPDLPAEKSIDVEAFKRPPHGTALLEVALLKLATLLREDMTNFERIERFLKWSFEEYLFIQEPVILALHQLAGNRSKPLLKGFNKPDPKGRLEGVRNALWDCLLIREWIRRVETQNTEGVIWLLCSRDETLRDYARKLIDARPDTENASDVVDLMLGDIWPAHQAKKISMLYHQLISMTGDPSRQFNRSGGNLDLDLEAMKKRLLDKLVQ
jgi:hypothetical protein